MTNYSSGNPSLFLQLVTVTLECDLHTFNTTLDFPRGIRLENKPDGSSEIPHLTHFFRIANNKAGYLIGAK